MSIVLLTSIIFTTMVYSAFSTKLQIGGELVVRSDNDIRVINLTIKESTNEAYETYNSKYTKDTTSMFVTLPSNSSITYEVEISNKSDSNYTLSSLNELSSLNSNLSYVIDTEQYDIYDSNNVRIVTITISNNTNNEISDSLVLEYKFDIAYSMFIEGISFNVKIKSLSGNTDATFNTNDINIISIVRSATLDKNVTEDNIISTTDSTVPIYAWFDNGIIYYYTKYERPLMNYIANYMFSYLSSIESIEIDTIDTSKTNDMGMLFAFTTATTIKGLDNFDTSNVLVMKYMFWNSQAEQLNLSSFDTSSVTDMSYMFSGSQCISLDLTKFNTSNVINMDNMFNNSQASEIKGLENFDTSNVTSMRNMFYNSQSFSLELSSFNTENVTNMSGMFAKSQVTSLDLSNFVTDKVTDMSFMFRFLKVENLDLSSFDTSNVTNMTYMFFGTETASIIGLNNFKTSKVKDMSFMFMFNQCTTLDLSGFDTSNVSTMADMFYESNASIINLSTFDTRNVTDMSYMFYNSVNLTTIYASDKFVTDNTTKSTQMFYNILNLVGGNGTKHDGSHTDKEYARIDTEDTPGYFTLKEN